MKPNFQLSTGGFIDIQSRNIVGLEKLGKEMAENMFFITNKF